MGRTLAWVIGVIASIAIIIGIVFGGWYAGWWFKNQNMNRTTQMYRHSIQFNQSYTTAVQQDIHDINAINVQLADPSTTQDQKNGLQGEKAAIINQACDQAVLIDSSYRTPDVSSFLVANCG